MRDNASKKNKSKVNEVEETTEESAEESPAVAPAKRADKKIKSIDKIGIKGKLIKE